MKDQSGISSGEPQAKCQNEVVGGAAQGEQDVKLMCERLRNMKLGPCNEAADMLEAISRPNAPVLQGERETFEAEMGYVALQGSFDLLPNGNYKDEAMQLRWLGWQARASIAPQEQQQNLTAHLAEPAETSTDTRLVSGHLLNFLDGSGAIDGVWFGDPHPAFAGRFWWRKVLRADIEAMNAAPIAAPAVPENMTGEIEMLHRTSATGMPWTAEQRFAVNRLAAMLSAVPDPKEVK